MRLEVDRKTAAAALKRASAIQNSHFPICTHVKLEARGDSIVVTATDLEVCYSESIQAGVVEEGSCTAPSSLLNHALWASSGERANLRFAGSQLAVVCAGSKFRLASLDPNDFPVFTPPEANCKSFTADAEVLRGALALVDFCIGRDASRPYLGGVYFESRDGRLRLTATDGASIAIIKTEIKYQGPAVIVPEKTVGYLKSLEGELRASMDGRQLLVTAGSVTLQSKLIDHKYPTVDRVVPERQRHPVSVDAKSLATALNRLSPLGGDDGVVGVTARDGEVVLSHSSDRAAFVGSVPAEVGKEAAITFRGKRLARAISAVPDTAVIHLGGPIDPVRIESATSDDWVAVVMPWRDQVKIEEIAA